MRRGGLLATTLLTTALLGACGETPAPPPTEAVVARAALDRSTATLGDRVTYTLTVDRDAAIEVELPEPNAGLEDQPGLTVLEHGREAPRRVGDRVIEETWTRLRADQLGSYVLPPRTVRWNPPPDEASGETAGLNELQTAALYLDVESVLEQAEGEATDIRDLKPLAPPPSRLRPALIAAVAVTLTLLALLLWWWRKRRGEPPPEVPARPPHERALAALHRLEEEMFRALDSDDPRDLRRLYFRLSEIVRRYTEERFGLNATDLTSEEIVAALPGMDGLDADEAIRLRRFLVTTDPVKFASHRPSEAEVREVLRTAREFVEGTRPPEPPAEGAGRGAIEAPSPAPREAGP